MNETLQQFCQRILPIVQAGAEGNGIEGRFLHGKGEWELADDSFEALRKECEYRISQPKATPLPITPEMWAMIDPKYEWAALNNCGVILVSDKKPHPMKDDGYPDGWRHETNVISALPLAIDTTGIIPEMSLTKRPDTKKHSSDNDVDYMTWLAILRPTK